MENKQQLVTFLKSLTGVSWACLLIAAASLLVSVYAWLPLPSHSQIVLIPMHLATMAVLFLVFFVMAKHHWLAFSKRLAVKVHVSFPVAYWIATFTSLAYLLATLIGGAVYYPSGVDLGPTANLRIFSAGWLFLCLAGLGFSQWVGIRLRAYRAAV